MLSSRSASSLVMAIWMPPWGQTPDGGDIASEVPSDRPGGLAGVRPHGDPL